MASVYALIGTENTVLIVYWGDFMNVIYGTYCECIKYSVALNSENTTEARTPIVIEGAMCYSHSWEFHHCLHPLICIKKTGND